MRFITQPRRAFLGSRFFRPMTLRRESDWLPLPIQTASVKFALASCKESPCVFAPGNSSTKAMYPSGTFSKTAVSFIGYPCRLGDEVYWKCFSSTATKLLRVGGGLKRNGVMSNGVRDNWRPEFDA